MAKKTYDDFSQGVCSKNLSYKGSYQPYCLKTKEGVYNKATQGVYNKATQGVCTFSKAKGSKLPCLKTEQGVYHKATQGVYDKATHDVCYTDRFYAEYYQLSCLKAEQGVYDKATQGVYDKTAEGIKTILKSSPSILSTILTQSTLQEIFPNYNLSKNSTNTTDQIEYNKIKASISNARILEATFEKDNENQIHTQSNEDNGELVEDILFGEATSSEDGLVNWN